MSGDRQPIYTYSTIHFRLLSRSPPFPMVELLTSPRDANPQEADQLLGTYYLVDRGTRWWKACPIISVRTRNSHLRVENEPNCPTGTLTVNGTTNFYLSQKSENIGKVLYGSTLCTVHLQFAYMYWVCKNILLNSKSIKRQMLLHCT